MREFNIDDVFLMSEILDAMGLSVEAGKVLKQAKTNKLETKADAAALGKEAMMGIGIELAMNIAKNLHKAKPAVKQLIGSLSGKTEEEVSKMGIKDIKAFFTELVKAEGFSDFLESAGA